jgi:uncharacterized tellurite resistance protein B-like protein
MATLLELLGFRTDSSSGTPPDAVAEIAARLNRLAPERARYVAAFAVVLSRVAHADLDINPAERRTMEEIVTRLGQLQGDEAAVAVEIAVAHSNRSGGTEHFLATRELAGAADRRQREELLECLFEISAADGSISTAEESRIRQIASELGFSHREFAETRSGWNEHREILK